MPRIRAMLSVNHGGQDIAGPGAAPLRCVYVRHEPFGPTYITDVNGVIRDKDGNEGIDSLTTSADITIICQNSVARVLDGTDVLQRCPVIPTFTIRRPAGGGRATATVRATQPFINHFRLLNQIFAAYHLVWRQFEPFLSAGDFPLGRSNDLETTRNQAKRIEFMFPSPVNVMSGLLSAFGITSPLPRIMSITDPIGTGDWPRVYVETDPPEFRLFAGSGAMANGNRLGLTLVPSELAHALHFSLLTRAQRATIRNDYLGFILTQLANGLPATHGIAVPTTPMVAFIEALDHLSTRLSESVRSRRTTFPTAPPEAGRYVIDDLRNRVPGVTRVGRLTIDDSGPQRRIEARPAAGLTLNGSIDEGAIFGGLFLGMPLQAGGLKPIVEAVLESRKINFGQFRTWFNNNRPNLSAELDDVVATWGL
ncbi:MAG TPA: hypothetical protein VFO19_21590 [Vicinamibacterales bacterium]|nr:hypothetical protein [Vicinamibacterales bacterium]